MIVILIIIIIILKLSKFSKISSAKRLCYMKKYTCIFSTVRKTDTTDNNRQTVVPVVAIRVGTFIFLLCEKLIYGTSKYICGKK